MDGFWKRNLVRGVGSALFGWLIYTLVAGFDPGTNLREALDNHGWDLLAWELAPGQFISPLHPDVVMGIGIASGVLLLVWGGFWNWVYGEW